MLHSLGRAERHVVFPVTDTCVVSSSSPLQRCVTFIYTHPYMSQQMFLQDSRVAGSLYIFKKCTQVLPGCLLIRLQYLNKGALTSRAKAFVHSCPGSESVVYWPKIHLGQVAHAKVLP